MNEYVFNYSQYKKSINKNQKYGFTIIIIVIILLLGLCIFLKPKNPKILEFYFVELGCFPTYQNALTLSQEVNLNGGAGYIYFNGNYHVLASFYSDYDNAETVLENVIGDYPNACILTIESSDFSKQKNLTTSQNSAVENYIKETQSIILKLEYFANEFDTKKISFNELSLSIKNLQKDFVDVYDTFISSFKTNSTFNVAKKYAEQMNSSINNLVETSEQSMTSKLRYETVSFVINRHQLLSCF